MGGAEEISVCRLYHFTSLLVSPPANFNFGSYLIKTLWSSCVDMWVYKKYAQRLWWYPVPWALAMHTCSVYVHTSVLLCSLLLLCCRYRKEHCSPQPRAHQILSGSQSHTFRFCLLPRVCTFAPQRKHRTGWEEPAALMHSYFIAIRICTFVYIQVFFPLSAGAWFIILAPFWPWEWVRSCATYNYKH